MNAQETSLSAALAVRFRPDLSVDGQWFGGRRYWIVKDPVSLRYFKFREEEYAVIRLLDGKKGLEEIRSRFEQQHAPRRITLGRLQSFLINLGRNGLLLSDAPDQAQQLLARRQLQRRGQVAGMLASVLAIRLPGFDPQPFLDWLYPKVRWCFTPWFLAACMLSALTALLLVTAQAGELSARLPDFHAFVSAQNLVWLAVALAFTKVLHEFGHALTCRHFGGECHEMGVMLLVFTPCLYCNVTDSWMLRNRWQRITISGAGILVEIMLASVAAVLWWYSRPGLFNSICLNIMVVCAVGTLLLNGNPLLRYDGYFILSDLIEAPNLWSDSRTVVRRAFSRWTLGLHLMDHVSDHRRRMLAIFGIASMTYRVFVVVAIFVFLLHLLAPAGMQAIVYLIALSMGGRLVWSSFTKTKRIIGDPLLRRQVSLPRVMLTSCFLLAAAWLFFFVPLPWRASAPLILELDGAQYVFVSEPGILVEAVSEGSRVSSDQMLARLKSPELEREVVKLESELAQLEQRVSNLESRAVTDSTALAQLPATREMVADVQQRLSQRRSELQSLILKAPIDGIVLPPPRRRADQRPERLDRWVGTPLERSNTGCTLQRGDLLCLVGDPTRQRATLYVDEADIELLRESQRVRMSIDQVAGHIVTGTIYDIADQPIGTVPAQLAATNEIPHEVDSDGQLRPLRSFYQLRVRLDPSEQSLLAGARGLRKVRIDPAPLSRRLHRLIRRTFKIPRSTQTR